jgi:mitochondrial import inner membrane translocase subunit TIM50
MAKDNRPKFHPPRKPNDYSKPPESGQSPSKQPSSIDQASPAEPKSPPPSDIPKEAQQDLTHQPQKSQQPESQADVSAGSDGRNNDLGGDTAAEPSSDRKPLPFDSLPDLTQGIPSTLAYETSGATNRSALASISADDAGGRSKGELPASAYVSSSERRRKMIAAWMLGSLAIFTVGGVIYLGRNWEEDEAADHPNVPNGWGLGLWWNRSTTRMREWTTYYQEPAFEKLLPDPDPSFARPYTLCISLEDMLVHSEWSRDHGWRVAKRPGVDYFLRYLSQYYELVLFTTVPFSFGEPLVRKLDPYRIIMWPLFREATKYKDGEVIKVRTIDHLFRKSGY